MMKNGLSLLLLLKSPQKGLVPSKVQRLVSDVVGVSDFSSVALMGNRRFFHTGGIATESLLVKRMYHVGVSSAATLMGARRFFNTGGITRPLVKRDMFRVGSNLYHSNKSHMLPNFVRPLAFSSASQSSGHTPNQEPMKEEKKCQTIRSSKLQRERSCDETSSTEVSLNQFPGLMVHGMVKNSKNRRLLRLNPGTGYFEQEEQDVAAAASANHDHSHHYELQVPHKHVCRGSAYGWLFLTDDNLDMKLLNPFSGAEIQLPPVKTLLASEAEEDERCPPSKWFVYKAVFSANPSMEPRPVVFIIYEGDQSFPRLAFCKPGDEGWTPLEFPIKRHFQFRAVFHKDVVYQDGQFYVLSHPGYVATFDIGRRIDDDDLSVKTTLVATAPGKGLRLERDWWYLAVLDEELVKFELRKGCFYGRCIKINNSKFEKQRDRDGDTTETETETETDSDEEYVFNIADADEDPGTETETDSDEEYDLNNADADEDSETETETIDAKEEEDDEKDEDVDDNDKFPCVDLNLPFLTKGIKIRRFDASEKKWVKMESLGDKAVFLGYNPSFALSASDYPTGHCIPNSIYFTYGEGGNKYTEKVCYDMGIYNVKDKSFKRPLCQQMPMVEDYEFKKPAPIWIVNSADG